MFEEVHKENQEDSQNNEIVMIHQPNDVTRSFSEDAEISSTFFASYHRLHELKMIRQIWKAFSNLEIQPLKLHKISNLILNSEALIHGTKDKKVILRCIQENIGSTRATEKILDFFVHPGKLKELIYKKNQLLGKCLGYPRNVFMFTVALLRLSLFYLDTIKDLAIYWRMREIFEGGNLVDSGILACSLFSLVFSYILVGLFIFQLTWRNKVFKLRDRFGHLSKALLLALISALFPFSIGVVIFISVYHDTQKQKIAASFQKDDNNKPSEIHQKMEDIELTIHKYFDTFVSLKMIEATVEGTIQAILLFTLFLSRFQPNSSRLGFLLYQGENSRDKLIFYISLPFTFVTILSSIIDYTNYKMKQSLNLKAKIVLTLSYVCFLTSTVGTFVIHILCCYSVSSKDSSRVFEVLSFTAVLVYFCVRWLFVFLFSQSQVQGFAGLDAWDKIFHVLFNTFVSIPLREAKDASMDRSRNHEWFGLLTCTLVLNLLLSSSGLVIKGASLEDFILLPGCLVCGSHLLGCLLLSVYYSKVHMFRSLNLGVSQHCHFLYQGLAPITLPEPGEQVRSPPITYLYLLFSSTGFSA